MNAASVGTDAPSAMLMEVKASKQGVIAGESPDGRIPVLMLQHLVTAPRDAATGLATGKRIHQPLVISKAVDKSTPGLYAALTTNEVLPKVTIRWYRGSEDYFITELSNAVITSIEVQPGTPRGQVESVSFSYQQITWTSLPGNQQTTDNAH
jgi:type VI secretion system secreted protein Hcp